MLVDVDLRPRRDAEEGDVNESRRRRPPQLGALPGAGGHDATTDGWSCITHASTRRKYTLKSYLKLTSYKKYKINSREIFKSLKISSTNIVLIKLTLGKHLKAAP